MHSSFRLKHLMRFCILNALYTTQMNIQRGVNSRFFETKLHLILSVLVVRTQVLDWWSSTKVGGIIEDAGLCCFERSPCWRMMIIKTIVVNMNPMKARPPMMIAAMATPWTVLMAAELSVVTTMKHSSMLLEIPKGWVYSTSSIFPIFSGLR